MERQLQLADSPSQGPTTIGIVVVVGLGWLIVSDKTWEWDGAERDMV